MLFRLTLNNQTDKMLEIDWIKTRYIYNDYMRGGFVLKGIKAKDIKNLTIGGGPQRLDNLRGELSYSPEV